MNGVSDQLRRLVSDSKQGRKPSSQETESRRSASGSVIAVGSTPEPVVGVKTAARFLAVSPSLVYAYVERRQVPHYRLGRSIRFRISELDEWLKRFHLTGGTEKCQ